MVFGALFVCFKKVSVDVQMVIFHGNVIVSEYIHLFFTFLSFEVGIREE